MQRGYVSVAKAIAEFEPVTMVAHPDHADDARRQLGNHAEVIELPIDDAWIRDSGPTFVTAQRRRARRYLLAIQCLGPQTRAVGRR